MVLVRYLLCLTIITQIPVQGETCDGYCRAEEDCLGPTNPVKEDCPDNLICCKGNHKSDEKCKEYEQHVYQKKQSLALTAISTIYTTSECSIEAVPLVVGGVKAKEKEFPHMVAIGYGEDTATAKWMCGGSLISEIYVLSAAHCSKSKSSGLAKFARIGTLNLYDSDDLNVQDFTIVDRINHPKYKAPSRYNDIALFKLSQPVKIDGYARPACLHVRDDELDFKKAVATGWGKLDYDANEGTPNLMKVTLDLIDYSVCNQSFSSEVGGNSLRHGIVTTQLCAGNLKGGKDTCQGDSGGPLQIVKKDSYCMYAIIGITSFGKFCGFKNSPAVYTKVSYYVPWIESIVWP